MTGYVFLTFITASLCTDLSCFGPPCSSPDP